jgi:malonate decarboxylase delta subunit
METIDLEYPATRLVRGRAHVGIVGSGDLEVLLEPSTTGRAHVRIRTSVTGYRETWKAVVDRFFSTYDGAVSIEINDAGATPGAVALRLEQAAEASER